MIKLSKDEEETLYKLVENLTSSCQSGSYRKEVIARSVEKRMKELSVPTFHEYLQKVEQSSDEFSQFMSNITIHTTSWFREIPHYDFLKNLAEKRFKSGQTFKLWSAACSTGEEVYSAALVLESVHPPMVSQKMYEVFGSDIDPMSVQTAEKAVYSTSSQASIPKQLEPFLLLGRNKAEGFFTLRKDIRSQCHFSVQNLVAELSTSLNQKFDAILLRNTLIYFDSQTQQKIIQQMLSRLNKDGVLILGHCDTQVRLSNSRSLGNSCYQKVSDPQSTKNLIAPTFKPTTSTDRPKLLIVDDSPTIRQSLKKRLNPYFDIDESASAENANMSIERNHYDLITLDLNLPGENGASWLKRNRQLGLKTPVIIVSESSSVEAEKIFGALENGAQDYVVKSSLQGNPQAFIEIALSLTRKKSTSHTIQGHVSPFKLKQFRPEVILIGASTGGPEALTKLLKNFPKSSPPIVVVQHISPEFSKALGARMAGSSGLKHFDGKELQSLEKDCLYMASGDYHLHLTRKGHQLCLQSSQAEKEQGHRPSIDTLFTSAANANVEAVSILLTGMGCDGAAGTQQLFKTGCSFTMAQDEGSCVVYGMPKKAIELHAVHFVGNIPSLRKELEIILNCSPGESRAA